MKIEEKDFFENVWKLIECEEFSNAEKKLLDICANKQSSLKSVSYANYMIGYIHTARNNDDKKRYVACQSLLSCIESEHPNPMAYLIFADIQEDKNVALNYLIEGLKIFPFSPYIYSGLLKYSKGIDKAKYIDEIASKSIIDVQVLETAIEFLIAENEWHKAEQFLQKVINVNDISDYHKLFGTLLYSFSLIIQNKDIDVAEQNFKKIIRQDVSNELRYAHSMGCLWCLIKNKKVDEAIAIFDIIPISMGFEDLIDGPNALICVDFVNIYNKIFAQLRIVFEKDKNRKLKTDALEAFCFFTPSKIYDICRYKKKHIKYLKNYLSIDNKNLDVACALFNMQLHYGNFFDAYCTYVNMLGEYLDPKQNDIYEIDFYEKCSESEIVKISNNIINKLKNDFDMDMEKFIPYIFDPLVNSVFNSEVADKYNTIVSLAQQISLNSLFKSSYMFEIAYSYAELDPQSNNAKILYLEKIKEQPENTSSLNNIGVIYEKRGNLSKALGYFQKAYDIRNDEKFRKNFDRVHRIMNNYEKSLTAVKKENVWLLGKLKLIYTNVDLKGEFFCSYQNRTKLLALSSQKATEVFNKMLKNKYIEKISSGDEYIANRYAVNPLIKEYLIAEDNRIKQNEVYEEMASCLNYDDIVNFGYTEVVEDTIDSIKDSYFKELLKRDVREAVVALAIKQYKSCIVMCGSVIETILTSKIISSGYQKYDIGLLIKKCSKEKKVLEMDLNELLELAKKEGLIDMGEYHLSNFVRCYRNIIHPSVEIRKKYNANENNARMMWNALLMIINRVN